VRVKKTSGPNRGLHLTLIVTDVLVKNNGRWLVASHQSTEPVPGGTSLRVPQPRPLGAYDAVAETSGPSADTAVQDAVVIVAKQFVEAYRSCDTQGMDKVVTDDVLYQHSVGTLENKERLFRNVSGCRYDEMTLLADHVRVHGDIAIIVGRHPIKAKKTVVNGLNLTLLIGQVYIRQNNRWLLASHQTTEPVPLGTSLGLGQ